MTDLTLDDWRALVARLGERSPERRALAAAELERLATASAADWTPLGPEQTAAELQRAFHGAPSARQERSAVIAETLADAEGERSAGRDVAQALGVAPSRARALIAEHRANARPDARALGERTAVSAR
jgi:hypothetical protein